MKHTSRILSLVLCLILALSLALPVMAAGDYTITITNSDSISSAGHKYHAYQIFSGKLDSTGTILTEIEWGENIAANAATFLAALKADADLGVGEANIFYSAVTAEDVAGILAQPAHHTSTVMQAFAKAATANITGAPVASSTETNAPYTIVIPEAKSGYYLVQDDASVLEGQPNKDVSDFILQVVADVTVEHKGSIPTMDKQVSETGNTYQDAIASGITDPHFYRIIAELPDDYMLYDSYYLEFSDNMSKGLSFDEVVEIKALIRSSGTSLVIDSGCYTVTTNTITDSTHPMYEGTHLSATLTNTKALTSGGNPVVLSAIDAIEIIYKAHVNTDAIVDGNGIPNQATIIYSNNPNTNGKGESTPDETNVYPINLNLLKVDGKDKTVALAGAQFLLSRDYSDGMTTHKEFAVVEGGKLKEWAHHAEGDGCAVDNADHLAAVAANELGTVLTTDATGNINVGGLDAGKFTLIEIKAPDGYNKLVEEIVISVSITVDETNDKIETMAGMTNQGQVSFNAATATVKLTIDNYKGDVLPSTGGIGTTLFYIFGGLMAAGAAVLLVTKKRMSAEA